MTEACFCGRTGKLSDRELVTDVKGVRALRCPDCGHLDRLEWLPATSRHHAFESAQRTSSVPADAAAA